MTESIQILSLCCVYPTRDEPSRGVFIRARLEELGRKLSVRVVAPVPWIAWGRGTFRWARPTRSLTRQGGTLPARRPRWLQLPGNTWVNGPLLALQLLPLLIREWRRSPWDAIDAHFGIPEGMAGAILAWLFSCRLSITLRGRELAQAHDRSTRLALAWTLQRADRVIAVSAELEEHAWNLGVPFERTRLIPNGVNPDIFHPLDRGIVRAELGIEDQIQLVLVVARIDPVKGILDFLNCLPRLIREFPNLRICLVGGVGRGASTYAEQVEARVRNVDLWGRVELIGPLPQSLVVRWMNAADLLCLPSRREGCPNVVLEALACGLPVLATAVGAVPELLADSHTGLVIPAHDQQALEAGLRRCLNQEWSERRGMKTSEVRRWGQVAEELVEAFAPLRIRGKR